MVGIDLGTTNTVVAIMDGPRPRVLDNREGRPQTRSVISLKKRRVKNVDSEEILIGDVALDNWPMAPKDTIISIKRLMGRAFSDVEVQKVRNGVLYDVVAPEAGTRDSVRVKMGGKEYSPVDVSAMVLKKAKEDAEFRLGEEVTHAVITVPAYFSQIQRDATRKAGLQAGLKVIKILDEPTAAAIAFGTETNDGAPRTILVYDLGGGTFDVSLLMLAGNIFAPLNLEGDMWLGGDNLDEKLVDFAIASIKEDHGIDPTTNLRFMAELKKAAQAAKERLSAGKSADLIVTGMLRDATDNLIDVTLEITREDFERMILPLVGTYRQCSCGQPNFESDDACAKCGKSLRGTAPRDGRALLIVKKGLENANQSVETVDFVLMAGNSTMIPLVQKSMEEFFGAAKVQRKIHPKHSVALGAAIVAAWIGNRVVCQAPDPSDPKRECGFVNTPEATVCAQCGTSLELEIERPEETFDSDLAAADRPTVRLVFESTGDLAAIAPFHYGTQSAGDKFNLFIRKGDPYPTENPKTETFFTRTPNQRMLSIPVYGGDDLTKASANARQGEAFALLPPGLPQDTAVRIKVWLNSNGIFELASYLEDGTDLHPWNVHGESDARAIDGIQKLERIMAEKGPSMPPGALRKMEQAREEVFDAMRKEDFDGALRKVDELAKAAEESDSAESTDGVEAKAQNLIGYTQYILHQYSWVIADPNQIYRLTKLAEETSEALSENNRALLEKKVKELDAATDALPDAVKVFIAMRGAIMMRIQPTDPAEAAGLLEELDAIEELFKSNNPAAPRRMEAFAARITKAIQDGEGKRPGGFRCSNCNGEVPSGQRNCPACGEDTWIPRSKTTGGTPTGHIGR
jgi:molecular chaperone DnaK (HSP70)